MKRHRRGLARLGQDGKDGVGVLARHVQAAIVAELYVEGMDHRRNVLGCHHYFGEVESVAVAAVPGDMAVLALGVGNVEIVAHQREAAGNLQRVRIGRRIEQQGMLLAGSAVILEDANVSRDWRLRECSERVEKVRQYPGIVERRRERFS